MNSSNWSASVVDQLLSIGARIDATTGVVAVGEHSGFRFVRTAPCAATSPDDCVNVFHGYPMQLLQPSNPPIPNFIFEATGTLGDVLPLLAVCRELKLQQYRCRLLADEQFRELASSWGVPFHPITRDRIEPRGCASLIPYLYHGFKMVRRFFLREDAFDRRTIVVNTHAFSASDPLAEAYGLPTVRLLLSPIRIRSSVAPAWPLGARALGPEGERFRRVTLPALYRAADRHPRVLAKMNGVRRRLGLPPVHSASKEGPRVVARGAFFPRWYGIPAADWPQLEFLGFPLPKAGQLPGEVAEFLKHNPRPIVFTTGTGFREPRQFFEASADCCRALGRPAIFLGRSFEHGRKKWGSHIVQLEHVELGALLGQASLIVHHGGVGTVARAIEAGVPQVVSPIGFDQPDNARRVEVLGVGRTVPRIHMSGAAFANAARSLLADDRVGSRLRYYRAAVDRENAVRSAARLLTTLGDARDSCGHPCLGGQAQGARRNISSQRAAADGTN